MALTRVAPAGIGSTPGTGYVIGDSFLHATGLNATNAYYTGIVTAQTFRVIGDFQVDGTTTTLDTVLTEVDKLEVGANNNTVGVAITQSGSGANTIFTGGYVRVNTGVDSALELNATDDGPVYSSLRRSGTRVGYYGFGGSGSSFDVVNEVANGQVNISTPGDFKVTTNGTEKLRITSAGNVGIGTNDASWGVSTGLMVGDGTSAKGITIFSNSANVGDLAFADATSGTARYRGLIRYDHSDDSLAFRTNSTERLRITSAGDVYLGNNIYLTDGSGGYERVEIGINDIRAESKHIHSQFGIWTRSNSIGDRRNGMDGEGSDLRLYANSAERVRITSAGKVGINSTAPATAFDVVGQGHFKNNGSSVKIESVPGTNFTQIQLTNTGGSLYVGRENNAGNWFGTGSNYASVFRSDGSYPVIFRVNGANRLRITSDGTVGINNSTPDNTYKLDVSGAGQFTTSSTNQQNDFNTGQLTVRNNQAAQGAFIDFRADSNNGTQGVIAKIGGFNTFNGTGYDGLLTFSTRKSAGNTMIERLRITKDGYVGINQASPTAPLSFATGAGQKIELYNSGSNNEFGFGIQSSEMRICAGTNSFMSFYTDGYTGNERLRITADGYVGINETSPDTYLHVKTGTDSALAKLEQTATNGRVQVQYLSPHGDWYQGIVGASNSGDYLIYTGQSKNLTFHTSGELRQKIQGDGKVIIGGNANQTANRNLSVVAAQGNSNEAQIGLQPTNSSGGYNPEVFISAIADGAYGAHMYFKTRDTSGNRLERLRIQSDGILRLSTPGNVVDGTFYASQTINNTGSNTFSRIRFDRSNVAKFGLTLRNDDKFCISNLFKNGSVVADDNAFVMTNSSNIGVGFASPQTALNVKGTISTGRNLAREVGTVISSSTNYNAFRQASNVINGKKNFENGDNDWLTQSNNRDNANLVIDLGAQYDVDRVVIYNQNEYSDSKREVKRFNLEGSNDNSSWTLLIDDELGRSDAHEPNPGFSFRLPHVSSPGGMHDDSEGASYRYWRFTMKDFHDTDPYGGIMEIELYGASNAVDSEVSTHSVVASDVYTQTLSAQRLAIGENGALGDFRANQNENVYINAAARFGQNTGDSIGNTTRHTGWRMYGYNPDGVNNRYQFTIDGFHGRKSFYYYFPNGSANQAIRFHSNRNSFWTCGFITINALYSHGNASGMLRYHFTHNANGSSNYGKTIVADVDIGSTSGHFQMSNNYTFKGWGSNGGSTTSHALELRHLNSAGNGVYVTFELYGNHVYNYIDDLYMTTGHTY